MSSPTAHDGDRLVAEQKFHDEWAKSTDSADIDPLTANEACTAPEMRWIVKQIGDLHGQTVLDVGCGLGEASVYFAMKGAQVTATDLSQGMLDVTAALAKQNGVSVTTHQANAESVGLAGDVKFDVIYVGNLFHHVEIDATLRDLVQHLKPEGVLVSWDPIAYNPLINVYRRMATQVRTVDEHPLTEADLKLFERYFGKVETRFYWLTTLSIFMIMAGILWRNPNKIRYWKQVVKEADMWRPLYLPLEALDAKLLKWIPPLRYLCWNVCIAARAPRAS